MKYIHRPEAYADADLQEASGPPTDVGVQLEGPAPAKHNGGFFEEAILRARERESEDGGSPGRSEVKVIANGHCHITDRCRRVRYASTMQKRLSVIARTLIPTSF